MDLFKNASAFFCFELLIQNFIFEWKKKSISFMKSIIKYSIQFIPVHNIWHFHCVCTQIIVKNRNLSIAFEYILTVLKIFKDEYMIRNKWNISPLHYYFSYFRDNMLQRLTYCVAFFAFIAFLEYLRYFRLSTCHRFKQNTKYEKDTINSRCCRTMWILCIP